MPKWLDRRRLTCIGLHRNEGDVASDAVRGDKLQNFLGLCSKSRASIRVDSEACARRRTLFLTISRHSTSLTIKSNEWGNRFARRYLFGAADREQALVGALCPG